MFSTRVFQAALGALLADLVVSREPPNRRLALKNGALA